MLIDGKTRQMDKSCDRLEFFTCARIIKSITPSERAPPNLMIWSNSKDERYTGTK